MVVVVTAVFAYINYKVLKLPQTIGLMVITLVVSIGVIIAGQFYTPLRVGAHEFVEQLDFDDTLLHGMLAFLLFAGALHVNLEDLSSRKLTILLLATVGVFLSTMIVGTLTWFMLRLLDLHVDFLHCLLFGALISPTDPIAVLGLLKQIGAPKTLEVKFAGESLFNDGIAVVIFLGLLEVVRGGGEIELAHIGELFVKEALGGAALGFLCGVIVYYMMKYVDHYGVEILLSLALAMGGYALAMYLQLSGPIAIVVAGLLIGNHGRTLAMSETTTEHLDTFWELLDEILNALLFVLIGLEVLILEFDSFYLLAGLLAAVITLVARFIAVGIPISIMRLWSKFDRYTIRALTWGGLRGGISVALALSLPDIGQERSIILVMTYVVVVFSILLQGLTIGKLVQRWFKGSFEEPAVDQPQPPEQLAEEALD